ncbi:MAG: hypothetical protein H6Q73_3205 [Firmicutes bacterium]|nr:hypothetical protein [Bacillota bacterium]
MQPSISAELPKPGFSEKLAFAMGATGKDLLFGFSNFLLFFYTDVFGISAVIGGTIFLVARIIDAFTDLLVGYAIEHTHTKWGKLRPYILYGAIPFGVISALSFYSPDLAETGKIAYAAIIYVLYMILYSFVGIPHAAMNAAITRDPKESASLSGFLLIGSTIGMLGANVGIMSITAQFPTPKLGFQWAGIIFGAIGAILLLICFAKTKERITDNNQANKFTLGYAIKFIFSNKPLMILALIHLMTIIGILMRMTVMLYYFKYNIGNESLFVAVSLVGALLGLALVYIVSTFVMSRFDKRNVLIAASLISVIMNTVLYFMPYTSITAIVVFMTLSMALISVLVLGPWSMLPDVVAYSSWKTGTRGDGVSYAVFNFLQKVAMAIGGALCGLVLDSTGYVPNVVQSESALQGISHSIFTLPSIASIIVILLVILYPLKRTELTIMQQTNQTNA